MYDQTEIWKEAFAKFPESKIDLNLIVLKPFLKILYPTIHEAPVKIDNQINFFVIFILVSI